jgi:hypothetical protein
VTSIGLARRETASGAVCSETLQKPTKPPNIQVLSQANACVTGR